VSVAFWIIAPIMLVLIYLAGGIRDRHGYIGRPWWAVLWAVVLLGVAGLG
jgi:hypothetical protein